MHGPPYSTLSEEALDIVRQSAERWNAGDFEGMFELYSEDMVVVTGEHWPEANVLIPAGRVDRGGGVPDYNAVVRIEKLVERRA